jgi:hypothetical protein
MPVVREDKLEGVTMSEERTRTYDDGIRVGTIIGVGFMLGVLALIIIILRVSS